MMRKISATAYRLQLPSSLPIHNVFHISLLKKWKTAMYRMEANEPIDELEAANEPRFEVERILRWRKASRTGRKEYLTLWTGYPIEEATWEPEEHFDDREAHLRSLEDDQSPEEIID